MSVPDAARLLPSERQQQIRQLAFDRGSLRISELAERFAVSEMTIRRDLEVLESAGAIERRFGGAVVSEQAAFERSYLERRNTHVEQKRALARHAAGLVHDGDTIAIDASTTGLALAVEVAKRDITVVTNGLDAAGALRAGRPEVILIGGRLRQLAGSFTGPPAMKALGDLRFDLAFVSAKGVLIPDGFMDSDLDEADVKRAMIEGATRMVALVDASKFGRRALHRIVPLDRTDLLLVDDALPDDTRTALAGRDLELHIVEVDSS